MVHPYVTSLSYMDKSKRKPSRHAIYKINTYCWLINTSEYLNISQCQIDLLWFSSSNWQLAPFDFLRDKTSDRLIVKFLYNRTNVAAILTISISDGMLYSRYQCFDKIIKASGVLSKRSLHTIAILTLVLLCVHKTVTLLRFPDLRWDRTKFRLVKVSLKFAKSSADLFLDGYVKRRLCNCQAVTTVCAAILNKGCHVTLLQQFCAK